MTDLWGEESLLGVYELEAPVFFIVSFDAVSSIISKAPFTNSSAAQLK